jgi:hypothetical protein
MPAKVRPMALPVFRSVTDCFSSAVLVHFPDQEIALVIRDPAASPETI